MTIQIRSEFARARLLSDRPLTFELAFDPTGSSAFNATNTLRVQLATRHAVGDVVELRQGFYSPWQVTQEEDGIVLSSETYWIFKERVELKANPQHAAIDVNYRLEFLAPYEAHEIGTLLLKKDEEPVASIVYLAGRQGVCPLQETVQHEVLVDYEAPLAGWLRKCLPQKSLWLVSDDEVSGIADWTTGADQTWVGLTGKVVPGWQRAHYPATHAAWPAPLKFEKGQKIEYQAQIINGRLSSADRLGLLISGHTDCMSSNSFSPPASWGHCVPTPPRDSGSTALRWSSTTSMLASTIGPGFEITLTAISALCLWRAPWCRPPSPKRSAPGCTPH